MAYHDACHALRVLKVHDEPRALLRAIPGLEVVDIANGDRCCGAAGLYNVTQPEMSGELRRQKAEAVAATGATIVASANPGLHDAARGRPARSRACTAEVVHPVQLLDRAYASEDAIPGRAGEARRRHAIGDRSPSSLRPPGAASHHGGPRSASTDPSERRKTKAPSSIASPNPPGRCTRP